MYGLESLGLILGVLVIVFALLLKSRPKDRKTYGALILVFSLVSFLSELAASLSEQFWALLEECSRLHDQDNIATSKVEIFS